MRNSHWFALLLQFAQLLARTLFNTQAAAAVGGFAEYGNTMDLFGFPSGHLPSSASTNSRSEVRPVDALQAAIERLEKTVDAAAFAGVAQFVFADGFVHSSLVSFGLVFCCDVRTESDVGCECCPRSHLKQSIDCNIRLIPQTSRCCAASC